MSGTGSLQLPTGTTAQRPTPATGDIRFNTSLRNLKVITDLHGEKLLMEFQQGQYLALQLLQFHQVI